MLAIETAGPEETGERVLKDLTFFWGLFGTLFTFCHQVVSQISTSIVYYL